MVRGQGFGLYQLNRIQNSIRNSFSDKSLLQATLSRLSKVSQKDEIYIVTVENQLELAKAQGANYLAEDNIILEPEGRNTALVYSMDY